MKTGLIEHFSEIKDPRIQKKCDHLLLDILVITILACLLRFDDSWESVEDFAIARENWLRKFLKLPSGIPSHDTFRRVFLILNPDEINSAFFSWVDSIKEHKGVETVSIDGKTVRGSKDSLSSKKGIHLINAWASENQIVLGQMKVDSKTNEITAIPDLLEMLEVKGCVVTIDAMGTQKDIAKKIVEKKADYILGLKGNQSGLLDDVKTYIDEQISSGITGKKYQTEKTADANHGRIEERTFHLFLDVDWLPNKDLWAGLKGLGMIETSMEKNNKKTYEKRYFITSLKDIKQFTKSSRDHWGIENKVHWVLDVTFDEDGSTRRKGHAPENSSIIRRIVLNLLRLEKTEKISLPRKRSKACLNIDYCEKILFG